MACYQCQKYAAAKINGVGIGQRRDINFMRTLNNYMRSLSNCMRSLMQLLEVAK